MSGATRMMWQKIQEYVLPHNLPMPSVWGKLPYYGDFTHIHTSPQDIDAWRLWFDRFPLRELAKHNAFDFGLRQQSRRAAGWLQIDPPDAQRNSFEQPWCFVLPAGALMPAPHVPADCLIVGTCAQSCDQIGRLHPVVIWQAVHPAWLHQLNAPRNWLYWLGRLLQMHTPPLCRPADTYNGPEFSTQLEDLWGLTRRSLHQVLLGILRKPLPEQDLARFFEQTVAQGELAQSIRVYTELGVNQLPWGVWQERYTHDQSTATPHAYFWQQASNGQYISAVALDLTTQGSAP